MNVCVSRCADVLKAVKGTISRHLTNSKGLHRSSVSFYAQSFQDIQDNTWAEGGAFNTIETLKRNNQIAITRPGKGLGMVVTGKKTGSPTKDYQ